MEKARGVVKGGPGATWDNGRELSLSKPALPFSPSELGMRSGALFSTSNPSLKYLLCAHGP